MDWANTDMHDTNADAPNAKSGRKRNLKWIVSAVILFLLGSLQGPAQSTNAILSGTVSDSTGAVIPGATIAAKQLATGMQRIATSDAGGAYTIPALPIGAYSVSASAPGFKTVQIASIVLQVNQAAALNLTMTVGAASEQVTVTTELPLVNSQNATLGQVIENRSIESIALNGRQFWQLTALTPGATYTPGGQMTSRGGAGIRSSTVNVQINGTNSVSTGWLLDGSNITDFEAGGTNIQVNVDALQEFKVQSAGAPAEFGMTPAVVTATLKSGSNEFHGEGFEFIRNNAIDARNYFVRAPQAKNVLRRDQFGGTFGGPILKGKLFFFTDLERTLQTQDSVFSLASSLPSDAMRAGIFPKPIKNPFLNNASTTDISAFITPQAKYFLQFMPTQAKGNFTAPQLSNIWKGDIKIDSNVTSKDHLMGRFSINNLFEQDPNQFPALGYQPLSARAQNLAFNETHTFGNHWLNDLSLGYYRDLFYFAPILPGTNFEQNAGITGFEKSQLVASFPWITLSPYSTFNGSGLNNLPKTVFVRNWQYSDAVSYSSGKHDMKFGVQFYHRKDAFIFGFEQEGAYTFTASKFSGDAFADLLMGLPTTATRNYPLTDFGVYGNQWAAFYQDTYRVTPQLSLDLGFRYDYTPFYHGINNAIAAFDFSNGKVIVPMHSGQLLGINAEAVTPIAYPLYQDRLEGTDALHLPDQIRKTGPGVFSPRLGAAFRPLGSDKLAIRGSYGIFPMFYDTNNSSNWVKSPPFAISQVLTNSTQTGSTLPAFQWADPFHGQSIVAANTTGTPCPGTTVAFATCVAPALYSGTAALQHSYMEQWNLSVQTQISKDASLDLSYVGAHQVHAQMNGVLSNVPDPGAGAIQTRRPFPQWAQINLTLTNGMSNYNALQAKFEKRYSHGFQTLVSYTLGKCLDNVFLNVRPDPGYKNSYGTCDYDVTNNLTMSGLYSLPFGKGRLMAPNAGKMLDGVIGGWEIAAVFTDRTGLPFTPTISGDRANTGVTVQLPDRIASGKLAHPTAAAWFDTSAFPLPPNCASTSAGCRYGNSSRNILRADNLNDIDATLKKNLKFNERYGMELRLEAFNLANHPTLAGPNSVSAVVTSTLNANRTMQAAAKFVF